MVLGYLSWYGTGAGMELVLVLLYWFGTEVL